MITRPPRNRGDTALRIIGVGLFQPSLADEGNLTFVRYFERETHTGQSWADDEKVVFVYHGRIGSILTNDKGSASREKCQISTSELLPKKSTDETDETDMAKLLRVEGWELRSQQERSGLPFRVFRVRQNPLPNVLYAVYRTIGI